MLASHYAPRARVRLEARRIAPGEAALLFGGEAPEGLAEAAAAFDLSPAADLVEAAADLFAALRRLDAIGRRGDRRRADPRYGARRGDQ